MPNLYKNKVVYGNTTIIDISDTTAVAADVAAGKYFYLASGEKVQGNIASKSSTDLTVSGATVTVPAGYYSSSASKSVSSGSAGTPTATKGAVSNHSVSVTPSVTNTTGYITGGTKTGTSVTVSASELVSGTKTISASGTTDVTNYESASVAAGSATTPSTSITANPTISVSSGGLITASVSGSKSVTPTVSAGYVSSGSAGTVSVSGSNTEQLATQAATTFHPSTTDQTIASGKYLTGAQTIKGVLLTNLSAGNIKKDVVVKVGDSADDDCVTSVTGTYEGGGTTPTGVKYIYTDIDGEGAWNVAGYEYCSVDYAPVWDGSLRYWFDIPSANYTQTISYYISKNSQTGVLGIIDWGDGTIDTNLASNMFASHEYANAGRYCVKITPTGTRGRTYSYVAGNNLNTDNTTLVGAECIDIATTTKQVAGSAFRRCKNLKKVSIKNGIEEIGSYAFASSGIAELTIPSSVTTIESYCFQESSLLKIHMKPTSPPTLGQSAFQRISSPFVIYVPQGSLSAYQSATNWSSYASQMQEES